MMPQTPQAGWGAQPPGSPLGAGPVQGFAPPPQPQYPQQGFAPPTQGFAPPPQGFAPPPQGFGAPTSLPMAVQQPGTHGAVHTPPPQVQQQAPPQPPPQPPSQPQTQSLPVQRTLPFEQQQAPQQAPQPAPAGDAPLPPTIQQLLRDFAKKPGCERYSGDGEKVKVLELYLLLRQLTPSLSFELFLQLYEPIADFDETNLKHPADAIKHYLPRIKKQAEERNTHHWSAKEVVDYLALYVDMIREAESTNAPIPMVLNTFLTSEAILKPFHEGVSKEVVAPTQKSPRQSRNTAKAAADTKVRPSAGGQRAIYSAPGGRQHRGAMLNVWRDEQTNFTFGDFRADTGEEFKGITIDAFEVTDDPPPNPPATQAGDQLPELGRGRLVIPKAQYPAVVQALALPVPIGTVGVGDVAYSFNYPFHTGHVAVLDVLNSQTGPCVDAYLCVNSKDNVVAECNPPRKNIEGAYTFTLPEGFLTLEVVGNQ